MKALHLLIASLIVAGCAQPANETAEQAPAPAPAPAAAEEATAAMEPTAYYEYLWCKNGENMSDEAMTDFLADWNTEMDQLNVKPNAAFGYIPRGWTDENFDGLWVLNWSSKEEMTAGWAEYAASGIDARINAKHEGVLTCGAETGVDRFPEMSYTIRDTPANFDTTASPYYLTNQLCSFKEGKAAEDLRAAVRGQYLPAVEAVAEANPETTYWFRIGAPDHTPLTQYAHDFNWVNIWQTAEEGEASSAAFASSEVGLAVQAAFAEIASCEPEVAQAWDGWFIRTGTPAS